MMSPNNNDPPSYYTNMAPKWQEEYPSSNHLDEHWSFYKECGYTNPQSTLKSMLEPITFTKKKILDYGCDKGLMLHFFCTAIAEGIKKEEENGNNNSSSIVEGYGIDINPKAIETASKQFPSYKFTVSNGLSIPHYPDKYFDVVIVIATMKHVLYQDRDQVYKELNRVADYALVIEADKSRREVEEFQGWKFYHSNFEQELNENFGGAVKVVKEGGDILGLYKCK
eukprot:CAMPEP_0185731602 /NCGR_PEP_ID=MMETSP1171-20130828/13467_1 /TAXON_ID=374046 /ORGANISM="Helicotheca tamensis, Strain CCMP826" /LENGTH=224 /DNA_ID=CAMNT_0028400905 /DNA_START=140 /DNA_END=814 /DNA_ORIENTATION=+